jgi:hypothetical protein
LDTCSNRYLILAAEARQLASTVLCDDMREIYQDIAEQYERLAQATSSPGTAAAAAPLRRVPFVRRARLGISR